MWFIVIPRSATLAPARHFYPLWHLETSSPCASKLHSVLVLAPLFPPPPLAEPQPVRPPLAVPHDLKASDDGAHLRPRTSTLTSTIRQGDSATRDVSQTTTSPTTAQRRCCRRRPSSSLPRPAIATPLIPTLPSHALSPSLSCSLTRSVRPSTTPFLTNTSPTGSTRSAHTRLYNFSPTSLSYRPTLPHGPVISYRVSGYHAHQSLISPLPRIHAHCLDTAAQSSPSPSQPQSEIGRRDSPESPPTLFALCLPRAGPCAFL